MVKIGAICKVSGEGSDLFLVKEFSKQENLTLTERIYDGSVEWHSLKSLKAVPDRELRRKLREAERTRKKITDFLK